MWPEVLFQLHQDVSFARVLYVYDMYKLLLFKLALNIVHNNTETSETCKLFNKPVLTPAVSNNFVRYRF